MQRFVVFTRVFIHVVDDLNRGFAGTAMDEPELMWVEQGLLVEEEGEPPGHCASDQLGNGFQEGHGAESFRVFRKGSNDPQFENGERQPNEYVAGELDNPLLKNPWGMREVFSGDAHHPPGAGARMSASSVIDLCPTISLQTMTYSERCEQIQQPNRSETFY